MKARERVQKLIKIDMEANNARMIARERAAQLVKTWPKVYPGAHVNRVPASESALIAQIHRIGHVSEPY